MRIGLTNNCGCCMPTTIRSLENCVPQCLHPSSYHYMLFILQLLQISVEHVNLICYRDVSSDREDFYLSNDTLLGALATSYIEFDLDPEFALTARRHAYVEFTTPIVSSRYCFYTRKNVPEDVHIHSNSRYFVAIPEFLWVFFTASNVACLLVKKLSKTTSSQKKIALYSSYINAYLCIGATAWLYNNELRTDFLVLVKPQPTFVSINELANLISSGENTLILDSMNNHKFGTINNTFNNSQPFELLKDALTIHHPIIEPRFAKICQLLMDNRRAIYMVDPLDFPFECPIEVRAQLEQICPPEMPSYFTAIGFRKGSKLVEVANRGAEMQYIMTKRLFDRHSEIELSSYHLNTSTGSGHKTEILEHVSVTLGCLPVLLSAVFSAYSGAALLLLAELAHAKLSLLKRQAFLKRHSIPSEFMFRRKTLKML